ncbi:Gpi-c transferase complex [Emericellopsis cladophorae]|uniref:Gpi-c transferase complex n=1 Tax=Emericellopsis cladophorae TaxID=2686198 RepID=A0A9Q0BCF9_9HYPO|nr:Gpi-c transferase complex [Emericellopsis cladophorae]KAI6780292.1 Gpi-c transferase complex [Emericellopsis cladophorae]
MLTTMPRLYTRRPSPTTAEFTVTTLPPPTIPLRILRVLLLALRVALVLLTALALHARWLSSPYAQHSLSTTCPTGDGWFSLEAVWYALDTLHKSGLGQLVGGLVENVPLVVLLPVAAALCYLLALRVHTTESLLVMRGLGMQTSSSPATYLASATSRFIPTEKIRDVFVNEAFRGFEVRYYLIVVVEGEENVVVVFPRLLPRRAIVETVWRCARACLYEGRCGDTTEEKG